MKKTFATGEQSLEVVKRVLRSLNQALDVVDVIASADRPMGTTELATATGLSKAAVHAVLANLEARKYLVRDRAGPVFSLGPRLWELGRKAGEGISLADAARSSLNALTKATGENSHVAVYCAGGEILFLDRVRTDHPIQVMIVPVGQRAPATTTALGHVLLAYQDPAEVVRVGQHLHSPPTGPGITKPSQLKAVVADVQRVGHAVCRGLHHEDVVAIAAPVRDVSGDVVAALGVFGPAYRFSDERVTAMTPHVVQAANNVSEKLGYISSKTLF